MTGDILRCSVTIDPAPTPEEKRKKGEESTGWRTSGASQFPAGRAREGFHFGWQFPRTISTEWLLKIPTRGTGMGMLLSILLMTCSFPLSFPSATQHPRPRNLLPCVSRWEEKLRGSIWISIFSKRLRSIDRRLSPVGDHRIGFCCFPPIYVRMYFGRYSYVYRLIPGRVRVLFGRNLKAQSWKFELQDIWRVR